MIGRQDREQSGLFLYVPSLGALVPEEHILKRVDRVLDLSFVCQRVRGLYCEENGRPGIDPQAAVRLMLAGLLLGIVHDRRLMVEAQVNVAIRWFAGYGLQERLPDHSSLTRIRQRWGAGLFKEILHGTVRQCMEAGLASGELVHVDQTLVRADVSWESVVEAHAERVLKENGEDQGGSGKVCKSDPDATLAKEAAGQIAQPSYKHHTALDGRSGVVLDVEVTTGKRPEAQELVGQLERVEALTGGRVQRVTADSAYGTSENYQALGERGTQAIIPPRTPRSGKGIASGRFKYDARHRVVKCPRGRTLRYRSRQGQGHLHRAAAADCEGCRLKEGCITSCGHMRGIYIAEHYVEMVRARRRWKQRGATACEAYRRHRVLVEGYHGESKRYGGRCGGASGT